MKQNKLRVYITLEQLHDNRDLISLHDDILKLKKDGREVIVCVPIAKNTICPVDTILGLLLDQINYNSAVLSEMDCNSFNKNYASLLINTLYHSYIAVDDIANGIGNNFRKEVLKTIGSFTLSRLKSMGKQEDLTNHMSKLAMDYPQVGDIKFYKKSINKVLLSDVILHISSCMNDFIHEYEHDPKCFALLMGAVKGHIITAQLRGMNRKETIRFVQKNVKYADKELAGLLLDEMTI